MDRYIDALLSIRAEIKEVEDGLMPADNNPLVNSPHSLHMILHETWDRPYSREQAAFPLPFVRHTKFWPTGRINDEFGDRNLICSCPGMEAYDEMTLPEEAPKKVKVKA